MEEKESCDQFLLRNLKDASLDEELIKTFLHYYRENNLEGQIKLLKCHRCSLIESLHDVQKQIDSLDYLLYTLKKCCQEEAR